MGIKGIENTPLFDRLMEKIEQDSNGCWLFTGYLTPKGYGTITQRVPVSKIWRAHRLAYEFFIGPIPPGLEPDHLCRVRHCINPTHLELVTGRVNRLRGISVSALNAVKTACIHGHPFDTANTTRRQDGSRGCRACGRFYWHQHKHLRRATKERTV